MIYKRQSVAELKDLLQKLASGFYNQEPSVVKVIKSKEERERDFALFISLKPNSKKIFFFFLILI